MSTRHSSAKVLAIAWLGLLALYGCSSQPVRSGRTYTVKAGDTLYSIATRYGVDYRELARWNHIGSDYQIRTGQVLRFSAAGSSSSRSSAAQPRPPAQKSEAPKPLPPPSFQWNWPAASESFSATTRPNGGLGLMINGKPAQDVYAAAAGKVVYVGVGLMGYGQLLIIKHDDTYLSAYGYTEAIAVREGEQVSAGQKVAAMGNGPAGSPLLYFEIRANGKPIDPLSLLPRQR